MISSNLNIYYLVDPLFQAGAVPQADSKAPPHRHRGPSTPNSKLPRHLPVSRSFLVQLDGTRCWADTYTTYDYLPASHVPVIMSRRTLGGGRGRVLGTPSALSSAPSPQPKPRVLSPAASSVSLSSQASASQFSSETQDLTSRISLENGDTSISAAPAAPGAQLTCPICNEEMVRLPVLEFAVLGDLETDQI